MSIFAEQEHVERCKALATVLESRHQRRSSDQTPSCDALQIPSLKTQLTREHTTIRFRENGTLLVCALKRLWRIGDAHSAPHIANGSSRRILTASRLSFCVRRASQPPTDAARTCSARTRKTSVRGLLTTKIVYLDLTLNGLVKVPGSGLQSGCM